MTFWKNLVVALVAAFALAACSSSNDNGDSTSGGTPPPEPTPAERQMTLIENAQAGLDTALDGLDADDPTADQIEAVTDAMSLLDDALAGANDLSPNETEEARDDLTDARMAAMDAQATLDTGMATEERVTTQMEAIDEAQKALSDALDGEEISDLDAANAAYDNLELAIEAGDDLTDAEMASAVSDLNMADVTIANAELAMYENSAMADGATLQQMLAAYEGKLVAARRLASATAASAADRETANQAIGSATTKIAELNEDIQDAQDAASDGMRLANNEKAMAVEEAILAHTVGGAPPTGFIDDDTTADIDEGLEILRIKGEATIEPYQTSVDKKNNPFTPGTAQDAGNGWSGKTFARSGTAAKKDYTEMAAVYTDIEEAKHQLWMEAFAQGIAPVGLTLGDDGEITIATGAELNMIRFTGILPSAPPKGQTASVKIDRNAHRTGSFYGVSGDFECGGADGCQVTRESDGNVTITGSMTFVPDSYDPDTTFAQYVNKDTDYTQFGYWTEKTKKQREDTYEHDIETFHGGMMGAALALAGLEGTANYYGAAAGVYVKKDGADDSLVVTSGEFTAVAELTARFGGNKIAVDDDFEVEGTISGFMDGSMDLGFANLSLGGKDAMGGADIDQNNGSFAGGETDGGGTSGRWAGQFYGNAETAIDADDSYPMNVSGEFNGHFVNGRVAGAFGAEYDD